MQPLTTLIPHDLAEFEEQTRRYLLQQVDSRTYLPLRTRNGVYSTRQAGLHMVRIKLPAGVLTSAQARQVAEILDDYSPSRRAHITTRQDLQIYHLKLEHTPAVLRELAVAGLTTRFAGGNAVRNVKCCPFAGLHPQAPFDPTPHARALADYLLRQTEEVEVAPGVRRSIGKLPRKFKISFGGCCGEEDCGQANINDLGFLAALRKDARGSEVQGFAIKAGGGLSQSPREGLLLAEFVPADEIIPWAEAVLRVYMLHGNYEKASARRKARLKHLIEEKGWDFFRDEVLRIRATLPRTVGLDLERFIEPQPVTPSALSVLRVEENGKFEPWVQGNVRDQRQADYVAVTIRSPLTDFTSTQLRALAEAADQFGNGTLRLTDAQSVVLRFVNRRHLQLLYAHLVRAGLAVSPVTPAADVASCPGSDTCRIGVTSSRDLLVEVEKWLEANARTLERDRTIGPLMIRASGCPNACGQHHVATIGFHGEARALKVNGGIRHVPMAVLYIGGNTNRTSVHFARKVAEFPVCRVIEALDRVFAYYLDHRTPRQSFLAWAQRVDFLQIHNAVFPLTKLDAADERIFYDAGHASPFEVVPAGGGESGI